MLELREYQKRGLTALGDFLDLAAQVGAKRAFIELTEQPYRSVPLLPDLPYVCLRVPTGGGKTIMACHSVGMVAHRYLQRENSVCLWLVPTDTILDQTLGRLRDVNDPYNEALRQRLKGPVSVISLGEALSVQRAALDGETVVIVSTLAALRISETEDRKVYKQNGALGHHFSNLAPEQISRLDHTADGHVIESLANVLRLRRPIVIVDEAHNARTPLSFTTLARFAPSCVLEYTATPAARHAPEEEEYASNVLAHVSAAELKAEEMVKLPIQLVNRAAWTDAVSDALAMQHELEAIAATERAATGERIRPVVLFQAQAHSQKTVTITVEELERALHEDYRVPKEQIAVEIGGRRELEGVNILDPDCPIRYVITVQALREGWDCPWAYVLCSVAELTSAQAVEQLLGRVLRMPRAKKKQNEPLNRSYAFVVSQQFATVAKHLKDALVDLGFQKYEVDDMLSAAPQLPLFSGVPEGVHVDVPEAPVLGRLAPELRGAVRFDPSSMTLAAVSPLTEDDATALKSAFATPAGRESVERLQRASTSLPPRRPDAAPAEPLVAATLSIPQLVTQEDLVLLSESPALEFTWQIAGHAADLDAAAFLPGARDGEAGEMDVNVKGEIKYSFRDEIVEQLLALEGETGWTPATLTIWLDAHIPHKDLDKADVQLFILRGIESLISAGGMSLEQLARHKFRLRNAFAGRISDLRGQQRHEWFQHALFGTDAVELVTSEKVSLVLGDPTTYAPNYVYTGSYQFKRHLFPQVGELKDEGEESDWAIYIDSHPSVDVWVRNLERRPATSFWLPTSTDRFYPDVMGRLKDGRVFCLESKGAVYWSNDDSKEKRSIGDLWAARSDGKCIFLMPNGTDRTIVEAAFHL